jgi:hypothetical protein
LQESERYGEGKEYGIKANAIYNVLILFPSTDRFEFLDMQGYEVKTIEATAERIELVLWLQETESYIEDNYIIIEHANVYENEPDTINSANIIDGFIEKTRFIDGDDEYKIFLGNWAGAVYRKLYLEETDASAEDWDAMTQYQRACYSLLYLLPKNFILGENSGIYAADRNTFISNLEVVQKPLDKLSNGTDVYTAIAEVWGWHWENWESERLFCNPLESYEFAGVNISENGSYTPEKTTSGEIDDVSEKALVNIENINAVDQPRNIRSELSSLDNFLKIIGDNKITLIILAATGAVLAIIIYYNRKKNFDKENGDQTIS